MGRKKNTYIPKKKLLTGHTAKYDVYVTPRGNTYIYFGNSTEDYKNPKFWKKVPYKMPYKKFPKGFNKKRRS